MNTHSDLWQKLSNKEYRANFAALQLKRGVPFQIRAILKKRQWTQGQLAERAGLTQGAISRAQNPDYGNLTINTISRIAAGFDVAFVGRFVLFSDLVDWFENLSEEKSGSIEPFQKEHKKLLHGTPRVIPYRKKARRSLRIVPYKRNHVPSLGPSAGAEQLRLPLPAPESTWSLAIVRKVARMTNQGGAATVNKIQGNPESAKRRFVGGL